MSGRVLSNRATCAWALAIAALCCCHSAVCAAEATVPQIVAIRAGFAGYFKVGCWAPVEITLQGGAAVWRGQLELIALDGDAVPTRVSAPAEGPLELAAEESKTIATYVRIGQRKADVTVQLRGDDGSTVSKRFGVGEQESLAGMLRTEQSLLVTLGGSADGSDVLRLESPNTKVGNVADFNLLPSEWWGYEGVDVVIVLTDQQDLAGRWTSEGARLAALDRWVRMGGRLVLSVGKQAETVLASTSPLAAIAPGTLDSVLPLRQFSMLENYSESPEPLPIAGAAALQIPKLRDVRGKIESYAGGSPRDLPLVVRAPHGFGEIVFVAVDLNQPPFAEWAGRGDFMKKLLRRSVAELADAATSNTGQVTTLGFTDLSGQLRGALDQFAGVQMVPFWLVALLVLVYIICIGPLDYFVVKKLWGRMEATWITFALTVVLFSAGAYALAYGLKGRELRVNQVDLVDFDADSRLVRGTSWINLFSPDTSAYDLKLTPTATVNDRQHEPRTVFSWLGLPGNGFGGMNSPTGSLPLFTEPYTFSPHWDALSQVPIPVWSSKAFVGRWWTQGAGEIEAQLADNGRLVGTITSNAAEPLEDCVLVFDRWAYLLKRFDPGRRIDVETVDPQTVETFLRHVTVQGERNINQLYDRASFDVPRIVEMMSLQELAGGQKYTGLAQEYQPFVELSTLVRDGRAVLIGRRAARGASLLNGDTALDDAPGEHWTYHRYVFPVREGAAP